MLNFSEFPATTFDQWVEKIKKDLKEKELKSLRKDSREGIQQMPFSAPLPEIPGNSNALNIHPKNTWDCVEIIADSDSKKANQHALHALMNGANGLHFVFQKNWDWTEVSKDIAFEYISVYLDSSVHHISFQEKEWEKFSNVFWIHNHLITQGKSCTNKMVKAVNSGANVTTELAIALNELKYKIEAYLALEENEDDASAKVFALLATNANHLIEIAKIRAIKYMYAFMLEKMTVKHNCSKFLHVYSVPQSINKFPQDVETNLLRLSSELMSSILGGSDAIGILPYNFQKEEDSILAQDISRNVSNLLREEAYLDKCADPTKGAYYFEELSSKIIAKSWTKFQKLEACSSHEEKESLIQNWLEKDQLQRQNDFESQKKKFVGANVFVSEQNNSSSPRHNLDYLGLNSTYQLNESNHA